MPEEILKTTETTEGFLSPLFTMIKVIFQELCKLKFHCYEALTDDLKSRYLDWLTDLKGVASS